jgi:hypothetical protein
MEEIELHLCLDIHSNSIESVKSILTANKYYDFIPTVKVNNQKTRKESTSDTIFLCSKTIEKTEISNLHKIGEDLKKMKIGVKAIVARYYTEKPIKRTKKLYEFIHTIIVGTTVVGIVLGIDALHPKILTFNETASIIGIPILIDGLYALARLYTRK